MEETQDKVKAMAERLIELGKENRPITHVLTYTKPEPWFYTATKDYEAEPMYDPVLGTWSYWWVTGIETTFSNGGASYKVHVTRVPDEVVKLIELDKRKPIPFSYPCESPSSGKCQPNMPCYLVRVADYGEPLDDFPQEETKMPARSIWRKKP